MKFDKGVPKKWHRILEYDLRRYENEIPMSKEESRELRQWVQAGNSPYDNEWSIATEYGTPMDYISAKRLLESGVCLAAGYDTVNDNPLLFVPDEQNDAINAPELLF